MDTWIQRWVTKKNTLLLSVFGLVAACVLNNPIKFGFCAETYTFGTRIGCLDRLPYALSEVIALFAIPTMLITLAVYWARDEIFRSWARFAIWWVPISMFVIVVSPDNDSTLMAPTTRALFSGLSLGLFVLISLVIIVTKWIKVRKK